MNNVDLNLKFMKSFGLGNLNDSKLLLQDFTITFRADDFPIIDARYVNVCNIIDDELEEVLKTFELKEVIDE